VTSFAIIERRVKKFTWLVVLDYFFLEDHRTLVGSTFLNGTISLVQAAADQTDSIQALTDPAMVAQINMAQFILETGKIVSQGVFAGERTCYALDLLPALACALSVLLSCKALQ